MRGLRSTIALLVVLAGLAAYIYFVTWKTPATDTPAKPKVFAALDSDKVDQLTIKGSAGETTTLKKTNGKWEIAAPVNASADDQEAFAMASSLASLEQTRVVDESPANLAEYGLATPRITVDFKASAGDTKEHRLLIGDKAPTGGDVFAKRADENRVFLIPATTDATFDHTTFDLRDKTLVRFERDKVDGVQLVSGGKTIELAKSGSDWKITKPIQSAADFGSVEGVIGRLQTAQMKSIVTPEVSAADLKKYGLDKPAGTVTLNLGSARASVMIGGRADDNTVYARDAASPMVVTVDKSLADDLAKGVDEYRRKDLFDFRAFNATKIEITRSGQTIVLERVKGQKDQADKWHRASPNPKDVDKDPMDSLLSKLSMMRAESFADSTANTGLNTPVMTVAVTFDEGKKHEQVTFGRSGENAYASRPDLPGAAKIDSTDFTETLKTLDELAK